MIKRLFMIIMLLSLAATAKAQPADLGAVCWKLNPFDDKIRVWAIVANDPSATMIALPAGFLQGPPTYQLNLVGGSINVSFPNPGSLTMSAKFDNATTFFGGMADCNVRATINPVTRNGTWSMRCFNHETQGVFPLTAPVTGTLTNLPDCLDPVPGEVQAQQSVLRRLIGNEPND